MNIKPVDAFNCVIGIAGNIVAHDNSITPAKAAEMALTIMLESDKIADMWIITHDDDGKSKKIEDIFSHLNEMSFTPEQKEKVNALRDLVKGAN